MLFLHFAVLFFKQNIKYDFMIENKNIYIEVLYILYDCQYQMYNSKRLLNVYIYEHEKYMYMRPWKTMNAKSSF